MNVAAYQKFIASCDDDQIVVANARAGQFAVIGNPGSGKTRSIIARIATLVASGLDPRYILAMTFTRNAAAEMASRLRGLGIECPIGTIHSICLNILNTDGVLAGKKIDPSSHNFIIRRTYMSLVQAGRLTNFDECPVDALDGILSKAKSTGLMYYFDDLKEVEDSARDRVNSLFTKGHEDFSCGECLAFLNKYQLNIKQEGIVAYDDMLQLVLRHLISNPAAREKWRTRYSVVITDESQDSNIVQWDIARLLVGLAPISSMPGIHTSMFEDNLEHNLMAAGDPSQSLYQFRYADVNSFLGFCDDKATDVLRLQNNYRSRQDICLLGSSIVEKEPWHRGGKMKARREGAIDKGRITIKMYNDITLEAMDLVRIAVERSQAGWALSDTVILSRTSMFLKLCEIFCIQKRIPYEKRCSSALLLDAKEVLDLLSYLRVSIGYDTDGKALRRMINAPYRFIANKDIDLVIQAMLKTGKPQQPGEQNKWAYEALNKLRAQVKFSRSRSTINSIIELLQPIWGERLQPAIKLKFVLNATGYADTEAAKRLSGGESTGAIVDIVLHFASMFKTTYEFLCYIDQLAGVTRQSAKSLKGQGGDRLILSTIHACKGLEFPHVLLADVVAGRFPSVQNPDQGEELRLLYVAITRASETLQVSWSKGEDAIRSLYVERVSNITTNMYNMK